MKKQVLFIFVLFIWCYCQSIAQKVYVNSNFNYVLTIPKGWEEIPKQQVDDLANSFKQGVTYDAGFYPARTNKVTEWGYPYILTDFESIKIDENKIDDFANDLRNKYMVKAINNIASTEFSDILRELKAGQGYYDNKKKRLIMKFEAKVDNVGIVNTIGTIIITKRGILAITLYYKEGKNGSIDRANYNQLVSTITIR